MSWNKKIRPHYVHLPLIVACLHLLLVQRLYVRYKIRMIVQ